MLFESNQKLRCKRTHTLSRLLPSNALSLTRSIFNKGGRRQAKTKSRRKFPDTMKLRYVKQTSAIIECDLWNRPGLLDKYSCKVKCTSRTTEEDASTVISLKEHPISVRIVGTFSRSKSLDPIFTPKAWHSSLAPSGHSEFDIHIRASIPSLDLLPFCAFIRSRVVSYTSPK